MSVRTISVKVNSHRVTVSNDVAGAVGGYRPSKLVFEFNASWAGMAISVFMTDARGRQPIVKLLTAEDINEDGLYEYEIPSEPLTYSGHITMTIRGVITEEDETERILTTHEIKLRVLPNNYSADAVEAALPATSLSDQLQTSVESSRNAIMSHVTGTGNKHDASAIGYQGLMDRVGTVREALDTLAEALNVPSERPIKMKKVLIYYGYPIAIHGAWSVNSAVAAYQGYDLVVFGDLYNDPEHDSYEDTCAIMTELKRVKPHIQLVGYVPVGNNATLSLSEEEIIQRIDWWSTMGADGVFLDEFGYDYLVTRERQNFCVSYAHSKSMFVFVNSWNDNYVFSNTLNEVPWISGFEPNPDGLPCLLNERDYSLYENLFWSAENVAGTLTGETIGATIWNIHRPYNYRYAAQAEYDGRSFAQQYGTQIICLDGFHSDLDEATRKAMQTISIFTCKILNINGVGFGDQFWGSGGQIVDWDLPNYDLDERNLHEIAVTNQSIGEDTIPMTYTAYVNGVEYAATFDVDSIADTEYTPAKRFVKVDGVSVVDAWDTLFAVRHKVDGFEAELASVVAEIQAIVDGVEDDITALGNLAQLQADLATLKTTLETTNTTVTEDVEDAIASLALVVSGFQYSLREW
jgi:hypothetical protein